jgi:hypothetical protein
MVMKGRKFREEEKGMECALLGISKGMERVREIEEWKRDGRSRTDR